MNIQSLHPNFKMPTRGSDGAGAFDLYMPIPGRLWGGASCCIRVPLGFAAEVPEGHVALLLPRSGVGVKHGLALNNTCGVIDADYRGEWVAALRLHNEHSFEWEAGDRVLQFLVLPVALPQLVQKATLNATVRQKGGFGSSGL